jgi:serpin B
LVWCLPAIAALAAVVAASCGSDAGASTLLTSKAARSAADPAAVAPVSAGLDRFGGELYAAAASRGDAAGRNVALSPMNIATALLMTRAGAAGATRTELDRAMHLDGVAADEGANAIEQALATRDTTVVGANGEKRTVRLSTANAVWAQRGYPIESSYLDLLATKYGAGLYTVDFGRSAQARDTINGWVSDRTAKKIPELIPPGVLDAMTRVVLTNAMYLKAAWTEPFDTKATADATFTRADRSTVTAPFMHRTDTLRYAAGDGWRLVELPYAGGQLVMDVIVPDTGRFDTVERSLARGLAPFVASLEDASVRVTMPRFTFRTQLELVDVLTSLGIVQLFDPERADLSGVTTAEKLYVSDVLHEAWLAVSEDGTEAAAATAVVIKASAAPGRTEEVTADRPFLFAIRDRGTGAVLMLGRVLDPTQG